MNTIEQYIEEEALKNKKIHWTKNITSFKEGFNSCIELNLPIKFAEWATTNTRHLWTGGKLVYRLEKDIKEYNIPEYSIKELYQYWINNIFKPE